MKIQLCRGCGHGVIAKSLSQCPHCRRSLSPYQFHRLVVSSLLLSTMSLLLGQQMIPAASILEAGVVFDMRRPVIEQQSTRSATEETSVRLPELIATLEQAVERVADRL